MERIGAFSLGLPGPVARSRRLGSAPIQTRLFLATFIVFMITWSAAAQDLQTVDNALPDFTKMSLEDLVQQEMSVNERLQETRSLTLQEGILGGHVHEAGEWMVGYNYKFTDMDGNRTGSNRVSTADVFAEGFMVSPTRMTMEMHMLNVMHAPSDEFTWMVMVPFKRLTMDHVTAMGTPFTTQSEGIGDVPGAAAIPDRRMNNSHVIQITPESYGPGGRTIKSNDGKGNRVTAFLSGSVFQGAPTMSRGDQPKDGHQDQCACFAHSL